jgi:hypothetical protein
MKLRGTKTVIKRHHPVPVWPEVEQPTVWQYKKSGPSSEEPDADDLIAEIESDEEIKLAVHYEFNRWEEAFALFYKRLKEEPNGGWCFVITRHWVTSGYWIERNAKEDEHCRIFKSFAAVKAYEEFVKLNLHDPEYILSETFRNYRQFETEPKKVKKKKPGAFSLITSKPAPAPGKRKIILED